jgi:hypothetical protein
MAANATAALATKAKASKAWRATVIIMLGHCAFTAVRVKAVA